jgi:hypothetical protein
MRKQIILLITGICVLFLSAVTVPSQASDIDTVVDWMTQLQYTDPANTSYGAIKIHHTPGYLSPDLKLYYRVVPYFSHLAVLGLLETDAPDKLLVAERWIDWYLNHLNMSASLPGIVYDHWYLADGTGETTAPDGIHPFYIDYDDSSDSYAALFLEVAYKYYQKGGSSAFLNQSGYREKIETVGDVVLALQDPVDGLTWAKDYWPVKYLMNSAEVFRGLKAMEKLEAKVFKDGATADLYKAAADAMKSGIQNDMYNDAASLYSWAKYGDGSFEEADLNGWYPGTTPLVWPHLFSVEKATNGRSRAQMNALNDHWDGDPNPDWTNNAVDGFGFTWPSIGYAALLTGDVDRALSHTSFVLSTKLPDFPFPFAVDEAGWLLKTLVALDGMGVSPPEGGVDFVQEMIDSLAQHIPTGDPATDLNINNAIGHIQNSFNWDLWEDYDHLTKNGKEVFEEGQLAVSELTPVANGGGVAAGDAQAAIDTLVDTYRTLAQITIDEAILAAEASGCYGPKPKKKCNKVLAAISNAEAEMVLAEAALGNGQPDTAVGHFMNAWEYTY